MAKTSKPQGFHLAWMLYFLLMIALVGSVFGYLLSTPFLLLGRLFPPARRWGGKILQCGIYLLMGLEPWLFARVRLELPPGAITVSNHRSHLDSFLLLSRVPNIRFLAKNTLFAVPFLGPMMWTLRQIPVRRGDTRSYLKAMETMRTGIRAGDSIHFFGEMTRCPAGFTGTQPFHLAPFHVAIQENATLVPVAIKGTDDVWPKGVFGLSYRKPVVIESLEPISAGAYPDASTLATEVRRRIDSFLGAHSLEGSSFA